MRKSLNIFFIHTCNLTVASNKQRKNHTNLIAIQKEKLKGAHERSKSLQFGKPRIQMQTLTRMDKVVIADHYHMTTMNEKQEFDETNTSIV